MYKTVKELREGDICLWGTECWKFTGAARFGANYCVNDSLGWAIWLDWDAVVYVED